MWWIGDWPPLRRHVTKVLTLRTQGLACHNQIRKENVLGYCQERVGSGKLQGSNAFSTVLLGVAVPASPFFVLCLGPGGPRS